MPLFDITSSYNNIIITDEDGIVNNAIEKNGITVSVEGVNVVISFSNLSFIQPYTNITVASAVPSSASDAKTLIDALIVYPWSKYSKRLVMSVTQSTTDAPTMTILLNELPGTFTWTRDGVGSYKLTSSNSVFTLNRTKGHSHIFFIEGGDSIKILSMVMDGDPSYMILRTEVITSGDGLQVLTDTILSGQICEIEVYPV